MEGGVAMNGSIFRIKQCTLDLISMEEDLLDDEETSAFDEESWELMGSSVSLKSTYLFLDLNESIADMRGNATKEALTLLANQLLLSMEELSRAARNRDLPSMLKWCNEAIVILEEITGMLPHR